MKRLGIIPLIVLLACGGRSRTDSVALHVAALEGRILPRLLIAGEELAQRPLADRMAELGVPAVSIAVVDSGRIAWAKAWGTADVATGRAATAVTLFQAASISKPVAATAMLTLVQEGRLALDTDVNTYLRSWKVPENAFTAQAPVTLRAIVTHTAGFTVHGFPGYARDADLPTTVGVLEGAGNTAPVRVQTVPGTAFSYSGGGYTVMQLLLTDVTGVAFADLMQTRVLTPVGMRLSTYEQPLPEARWPEAATGYRGDGEAVEQRWHVYPEQAAAGLWTTPTDLATWALAIQRAYAGAEGGVLRPATAREMLTPGMNHWGLGPALDESDLTFGHGGANEGFRCRLVMALDGSFGVAVMTNSDRGDLLAEEIIGTVAADYGWPVMQPEQRTVATVDPAVLREIAGRYDLPGAGVVTVEVVDNRLVATVPGAGQVTLLPESESRFFDRDAGTRITVIRERGRTVALEVRGNRAVRLD